MGVLISIVMCTFIALFFVACNNGSSEYAGEATSNFWEQEALTDSLRLEHAMMDDRLRYCRSRFQLPDSRLSCFAGYLAQPIPR